MNIFKNMEVLFIGPSPEHITKYVSDFWKLAGKLRADLGKNGYYLDEYLSKVFEVLSNLNLNNVATIADDMCWNIIGDWYTIFELDTAKEKSEFFDLVKEYVDTHPVNFEHKHTRCEFYAANILIEHLNIFTDKTKFISRKNTLSQIDYIVSNKMYEKISYLIGEKRMEILNETMCEAFVFGPIMMAAVQQIVIRVVQMLCYRDPESSKQLYQFMLEEKLNG